MKLFFRKPRRACGYSLQMVIDLDARTVRRGYFLTVNACAELRARDFEELFKEFTKNGYTIIED